MFMIRQRRRRRGFTLIELIMVIVILGILAAVAIPRFFDLADEANNAAEEGIVGAVRAGISTIHARNLAQSISPVYPTVLDSVAATVPCSATQQCFNAILEQGGITGDGWSKSATTTTYTHTGANTSTYTYDNGDGSFLCTSTCP